MLSYAAMLCKKMPAPISTNAPFPPRCPLSLETQMAVLNIQYMRGIENSCGVVFEKAYLEHRISEEIKTTFSSSDHHSELENAAVFFRKTLKELYPDSQCWLTGSYASDVDISGSDLDFTVRIPSLTDGHYFRKLNHIKNSFKKVKGISKAWVQKAVIPVLQLIYRGVSIDVTMNNDAAKRNTQLFCWYGQMDVRFPILCKAAKAWGSSVGVIGASNGRLNSYSVCLMMIHYLQVKPTPAVLPNIQKIIPRLNREFVVENDNYHQRNLKEEIIERGGFSFDENKESLATLFLGFLKYYAEFDFLQNWISVKNGKLMKKQWDENQNEMDGLPEVNKYIVVADPFLKKPRNCAGSVRQEDYMERIQLEFKKEYERIMMKRTILTKEQSIWKKKLIREGKQRDYQIVEAFNDKNKENFKRVAALNWGDVDLIKWNGIKPRPEEYWDETHKSLREKDVEEWPMLIPIFRDYYDPE